MNYKLFFGLTLLLAAAFGQLMCKDRSEQTGVRDSGYLADSSVASTTGNGPDSNEFNNTLLRLDAENVTRIAYSCEGRDVVLVKELDGTWLYAGMEAMDSEVMVNYLASLTKVVSDQSAVTAVDSFFVDCSLLITGNNMEPVEVLLSNIRGLSRPFVIQSSLNPDMYFTSDSAGVYSVIFKGLDQVLEHY